MKLLKLFKKKSLVISYDDGYPTVVNKKLLLEEFSKIETVKDADNFFFEKFGGEKIWCDNFNFIYSSADFRKVNGTSRLALEFSWDGKLDTGEFCLFYIFYPHYELSYIVGKNYYDDSKILDKKIFIFKNQEETENFIYKMCKYDNYSSDICDKIVKKLVGGYEHNENVSYDSFVEEYRKEMNKL